MTIDIANLPDTYKVTELMAQKFGLNDNQANDLAGALPAFRPERFSLPYADGAELALQRPFGTELRALTGRHNLHIEELALLDEDTFETAGHLDFFDRHGMEVGWALIRAAWAAEGQLPPAAGTRVEPIDASKILTLMRDGLAELFRKYTGHSASRSDFRIVGGRRQPVIVQGSCADFVHTALKSLGWPFTDADIAENYSLVIGSSWHNRDRS
ncbi:hypothetical protein [Sphingomonas colocasiae]|uniref:Uncharacterized protein n=1 Tax=Sphingomonas colocasiae TaxID=1848973 RepID=A0ABS7PT45_9SPHN|nr:hypothetical protein [Sphingomonas colocasiae]MBY8823845.1 hypothetical protein [Sphingomonas colocasiae]